MILKTALRELPSCFRTEFSNLTAISTVFVVFYPLTVVVGGKFYIIFTKNHVITVCE